jgi:hypothetical protein
MKHFLNHPDVSERYRVTLTLPNGALLTYETFEEAQLLDWLDKRRYEQINGSLIEMITTLVID